MMLLAFLATCVLLGHTDERGADSVYAQLGKWPLPDTPAEYYRIVLGAVAEANKQHGYRPPRAQG